MFYSQNLYWIVQCQYISTDNHMWMHKHIIFTNMRTEQDNKIFKKLIANLPLNFHTFLTKMHPPYLPDVSPVHIIRESAGEEGLFRRIC